MANLRTDYKDDILNAEVNTRRKYQMITNEDGTVSFVDVTEYSQEGDLFGALAVNAIAEAVNQATTSANDAASVASTAQSTADSAVSAASTAQSTANTAKTNAATAQSTANTAKTNASNAQTTANNAYNLAAAKKNIAVVAHTIYLNAPQYNAAGGTVDIGVSGWTPFAVAGYASFTIMAKPSALYISGNSLHYNVGPREDNYAIDGNFTVYVAYYQ